MRAGGLEALQKTVMPIKILQANVNHACQVQNIFIHILAEQGCGVGIVSEPYRVPDGHPNWTSDAQKTVAITWRNIPYSPPCVRGSKERSGRR